MKFYIVIAVHNEEAFIKDCLSSLTTQTLLPEKIIVVNDNSTDKTAEIVEKIAKKFPALKLIQNQSSNQHMPGEKVVRAFNFGLQQLDTNYDVICKFDGDLIFPKNYLETLASHYVQNPKLGMLSGHCYIQKNNKWIYENIASKVHIRGPLKSYRRACFKDIGGLQASIGWDTVDELIAVYYGWTFKTVAALKVKHLKPTGSHYSPNARYLQGEALYKMRSGFAIAALSALKMALNKKKFIYFFNCMMGYFRAYKTKAKYIVTENQGKFIRRYRWRALQKKIIRI
ncbi:MAG: glycosyl transferase family 2 [Formosa sp.]|nr:glycosyl transferase family 2 [Formosa sp.]